MLNFSPLQQYYEHAVCERKVIVISESIDVQTIMTEKCIDAGIKSDNVVQGNSVFNIERLLDANVSHIILDAHLYNYIVSNMLERYISSNLLHLLIYHPENDIQTIRLLTDKRLQHINKATTAVLLKRMLDED